MLLCALHLEKKKKSKLHSGVCLGDQARFEHLKFILGECFQPSTSQLAFRWTGPLLSQANKEKNETVNFHFIF